MKHHKIYNGIKYHLNNAMKFVNEKIEEKNKVTENDILKESCRNWERETLDKFLLN